MDAMDADATDAEDAAIDFLPFTFGQALHTLSGRRLPPEFHISNELEDPRFSDNPQHHHDRPL